MSKAVDNALAVLRAHGIDPYESDDEAPDLPGVGTIEDGETVYSHRWKRFSARNPRKHQRV